MLISNFCVFPSLRGGCLPKHLPHCPVLGRLGTWRAELCSPWQILQESGWQPLSQGRKSARAEFTHWKRSGGMGIATRPGARQSRTKIRYKIHTHTHTNQNYSGHEIMQTSLARNELQNTFIFSYSETLIKSQLLRSYSISGGITVFRTPLLMHRTSQSKRIRAQFPDANDLILSYLAVYI